jgi:transposase-like protein
MGAKKKWTAEEKLAVVLDGLKGRPAREVCREYGIGDKQYYKRSGIGCLSWLWSSSS